MSVEHHRLARAITLHDTNYLSSAGLDLLNVYLIEAMVLVPVSHVVNRWSLLVGEAGLANQVAG